MSKKYSFPKENDDLYKTNQEQHGKPYIKSKFKHTDNYNSGHFQKTVRHQSTSGRIYIYIYVCIQGYCELAALRLL